MIISTPFRATALGSKDCHRDCCSGFAHHLPSSSPLFCLEMSGFCALTPSSNFYSTSPLRAVLLWLWDYSSNPQKWPLQRLFWNHCWTFFFFPLCVFNQAWNALPLKKPSESSHFLWIIHLWTTLLYSKKRTIFCHLETHASFWAEINPLIKLIRGTISLERVRENMMGYKPSHRIQ